MKTAATTSRTFRTFLLVSQLEAKEIGARIALARKEAGLTQEQVSQMSTVSKRSLQNYEAGNTIPYRHMRELSSLLDRPVDWFLHGRQREEDAVTLADIARRLGSLEAQLETQGQATTKSLAALAKDVRALARRLDGRDGQATRAA